MKTDFSMMKKKFIHCVIIILLFGLFGCLCRYFYQINDSRLYVPYYLGIWRAEEPLFRRRIFILFIFFLISLISKMSVFPITSYVTAGMATFGAVAVSLLEMIFRNYRIQAFEDLVASGETIQNYNQKQYEAYCNHSVEIWFFAVIISFFIAFILDLVLRKKKKAV